MLDDLVEISRRYGSDSAFVLAGGGNTSFKRGNRLWVKASGHALASIDRDGFVELDRGALDRMMDAHWPTDATARERLFMERIMASRVHPELNQRPSVEALLHHLLPDNLVVHSHPGIVNAITCCVDGPTIAASLFGAEVVWQPYIDPGLTLAFALRDRLKNHVGERPKAIFLANHGFIAVGDSADAIDRTTRKIVSAIEGKLHGRPIVPQLAAPADHLLEEHRELLTHIDPTASTAVDRSPPIAWAVTSAAGKAPMMGGALTPDQIVYCRSFPLWVDAAKSTERELREAIDQYERSRGFTPWVFLFQNAGLIARRESSKLADITRQVFVDAAAVSQNAVRLGGVSHMTPAEREFIEGWEVEAYRRAVAAGSNVSK